MAGQEMPRVQAIFEHPRFQRELAAIEAAEAGRRFCRHGMPHLLDVARCAWVSALEQGVEVPRDLVYAAALLHDIGRAEQYAHGMPHDEAGARIADGILGTVEEGVRFSAGERAAILAAVRGHRRGAGGGSGAAVGFASGAAQSVAPAQPANAVNGAQAEILVRLIAEADHASRPCFACPARAACNWPTERKNLTIRI